ncbi:MAG: SPFH domain-containing protein [Eubacteriales bacterium]|nr:SPFH domain-containing protein [Eubacteriales bacterium]
MGLIKAMTTALGTSLADQYKEFFYCDSLDKNVLMAKGVPRKGARSQNRGSDNIISNGSAIAVADGQCMMIVQQGEIVEFSAEPGEYVWEASAEPSVFTGKLGESIVESFKVFGRRITFGGDTARDQRIYYFNIKEITDNKFGTPNPVAFRVVDRQIGLDIDISVRCNGSYSYHIVDPILFYKNVAGNVSEAYYREDIDAQMKAELIQQLSPAFAKISQLEIRPNQLMAKGPEIAQALQEQLSETWSNLRGIEIVSVGLNSVSIPKEDEELIKQAQRAAIFRDPNMAAAGITAAQADAMRAAAANEGGAGAMGAFVGLGMANQAGGANAGDLFRQAQQQPQGQQMPQGQQPPQAQQAGVVYGQTGGSASWRCVCGASNNGKFCTNCGRPAPQAESYKCDKCGYAPPAGERPNFCPECGDKIDEADKV